MSLSTNPVSSQHEPPAPPRTVKSNRRTYKSLPVVAVFGDSFLAESGETGTATQLIKELPEYEATLFCTVGAADFVAMLGQKYLLTHPSTWQVVIAPEHEASVIRAGQFERSSRVTVVINQFGWHSPGKRSTFHRVLDPVVMYQKGLNEIMPNLEGDTIRRLLQWAIIIRDFCAENNLQVKPTLGSISSQLLRHPRFYPSARRKVPRKINERARENLPGNHYFLNVTPDESNNFSAIYLDQRRAHHYHVRTAPLPNSNNCYAYGDFTNLNHITFPSTDPHFMGLYCLDLDAPPERPAYDWIGGDLNAVFIYSNELTHLLDYGYSIRGVRAAWGSVKRDWGIQRYAEWAESQLDLYGDPIWLKMLLHSAYGCLATRPMTRKTVYRLAKRGEPVALRTGRRKLTGLLVETPRKLEPGIAHVIQRGMIEAATRSESIGLAQWLTHQGHNILSIYADAVIVEDTGPLPEFIPEPWRIKEELTHLEFITAQAFRSDQMTKLPGVSHAEMIRDRRPITVNGHRIGITARRVVA